MTLLFESRTRDVELHHFALRDIEPRDTLSEQRYVASNALRSKHVCEIVRDELPVLSISKTEAVQIDIGLVGQPNRRHANFIWRFGRNSKQHIARPHFVLLRIDLNRLKPARVRNCVVENVGIGYEPSIPMPKVFFGFARQATVSCTAIPQLTLFPSGGERTTTGRSRKQPPRCGLRVVFPRNYSGRTSGPGRPAGNRGQLPRCRPA